MRIATLIAACLLAMSCGRGPTRSALISRPGSYPAPDRRHTLVIVEDGNGIINFSVIDPTSGTTVASGGGFSAYQRWFFHWDSRMRLWSYNSDMGPLAVREERAPGGWSVSPVNASSPLVASLPQPVRDGLPGSMKRALKLD